MQTHEILDTVALMINPEGIHYLLLYVLFDLSFINKENTKYVKSYMSRFHLSEEIFERIHGFWLVDTYMTDTSVVNKNTIVSLLSARASDWDGDILELMRRLGDTKGELTYGNYLSRMEEIPIEIIRTLYENQLKGQIYEYITTLKKAKVVTLKLIKDLCKLFINEFKDPETLFNFPFELEEQKVIENYLKENGNKELEVMFHIQRKEHKEALNGYKEIDNPNCYIAEYMERYIKHKLNSTVIDPLTKIEPHGSVSKDIATIYNIKRTQEVLPISPGNKIEEPNIRTPNEPFNPIEIAQPVFESTKGIVHSSKTIPKLFRNLGKDKEEVKVNMKEILAAKKARFKSLLKSDFHLEEEIKCTEFLLQDEFKVTEDEPYPLEVKKENSSLAYISLIIHSRLSPIQEESEDSEDLSSKRKGSKLSPHLLKFGSMDLTKDILGTSPSKLTPYQGKEYTPPMYHLYQLLIERENY